MSNSESFVSRWSRLKSGADVAPEAVPTAEAELPIDGIEGAAQAMRGEPVDEPGPAFDPASLPSIESIDIGTDIRGFLQAGVPPELTLAALRRAWASDPSIRDFIGIAENQWDFNDPTSIFGFGPMRATDNSQALLAQALGKVKDIAENVTTTQGTTPVANPLESSSVRSDVNAATEPRMIAEAEEAPVVAAEDPVIIAVETLRRPRGHGGALPK